MTDLRALLGDRYASTMRVAVLADDPTIITSAQRLGGKLGELLYLGAVDRLDRTLGAVLPDLLAAAWDEGHQAGHEDARAVQSTYPEPTPNPYRAEGEPR